MYYHDFPDAIRSINDWVVNDGTEVDPGHWQGVSTKGHPDMVTYELPVSFATRILDYDGEVTLDSLRGQIQPNLPWADDHFEERVGRVPTNPGEEYKNWPWWDPRKEAVTGEVGQHGGPFFFTHTYQERFWPKWEEPEGTARMGIRYQYGSLDDLVGLLVREPTTRQAYLPIFFPEDTGAVHGGRIPCTLGYHFLFREGQLHMWYFIRSCDLVRHFRDDLYLSCRLWLWVIDEWRSRMDNDTAIDHIRPGLFNFVCPSLHVHKGDLHHVKS